MPPSQWSESGLRGITRRTPGGALADFPAPPYRVADPKTGTTLWNLPSVAAAEMVDVHENQEWIQPLTKTEKRELRPFHDGLTKQAKLAQAPTRLERATAARSAFYEDQDRELEKASHMSSPVVYPVKAFEKRFEGQPVA